MSKPVQSRFNGRLLIKIGRALSCDEGGAASWVADWAAENKVSGIRVRNLKTDETFERPAGGFFVAIGHRPNTALFEGVLGADGQGYLQERDGSSRSEIPGVFIAGDVHDHTYRQAVTAAGAGCRAAIDCERWLEAEAASAS